MQWLELMIYILSVLLAMYGLMAFNFEKAIKKDGLKKFYVFYFMASIALGYLFASFILNLPTINF